MERMNEDVLKKFIEQNKYSITLKEWNHLKKRISFVVSEQSEEFSFTLEAKFYKNGDYTNVKLLVSPYFVNLIESYFKKVSHNSCLIYTEDIYQLKEKINSELKHHDITYSERDLMTDYSGSYRFDAYCSTGANPKYREIFAKLDSLVENLVTLKKYRNEGTSISLNDYLEICEKHDLSKEYITALYNRNK